MVKVDGSEWNRFYADDEAWPDGAWHEYEEITIDGNAPPEDFDCSAVADGAMLTVAGGVVYLKGWEEGPSLEAHFKRWRKRQTTTVLVVEVPHVAAEAVRAAIALDEAIGDPPGIVLSTDGLGAWSITRRAPYTEIGIKRLKCIRCGGRAQFQWQVCSDGNNHRPICGQCDVALNRMVLQWMGHPAADELLERYAASKAPNA